MTADGVMAAADEAENELASAVLAALTAWRGTVDLEAVASLLAGGASQQEIAAALGVVDGTIPTLDEQLVTGPHVYPVLAAVYAVAGKAALNALVDRPGTRLSTINAKPDSVAFAAILSKGLEAISIETATAARQSVTRLKRATSGRMSDATAYRKGRQLRSGLGLNARQVGTLDAFRFLLAGERTSPTARPAVTQAVLMHLNAAEQSQIFKHLRDRHLDLDRIDELADRLRDRLLTARAMTIARTEGVRTANQAEHDAWSRAADRGLIDRTTARRYWQTAGDEKVRDEHRAIPGLNQTGRALDEPFLTLDGPRMFPPAGPNCRCRVVLFGG